MNLSEMATFVRAQADTDITDAPDANLEVYARAAYNDIIARVFPWPDKRVQYTLTTAAGQQAYALSGLAGGADMEFILTVSDSTDGPLMYVSEERFIEISSESSGSSGTATCYTIIGSQIELWPTPSGAETLQVVGYRSFAEWPVGSDDPDLPRGFDEPIMWYMLARFYQAQEDLELYQQYMQDYNIAVNQQIEKALRGSSMTAGPMIFGGDPRLSTHMSYENWVKRGVEG